MFVLAQRLLNFGEALLLVNCVAVEKDLQAASQRVVGFDADLALANFSPSAMSV